MTPAVSETTNDKNDRSPSSAPVVLRNFCYPCMPCFLDRLCRPSATNRACLSHGTPMHTSVLLCKILQTQQSLPNNQYKSIIHPCAFMPHSHSKRCLLRPLSCLGAAIFILLRARNCISIRGLHRLLRIGRLGTQGRGQGSSAWIPDSSSHQMLTA